MPRKPAAPKPAPPSAAAPCDDHASLALSVLLWVLVAVALWYLVNLLFSGRREHFSDAKKASAKKTVDVIEIVYVFSPNCKYCTQFDPIWNKFTAQVKQSGMPSVTTTKSTDAGKYDVQAFPTVLLYKNGAKKATFTGQRSPENLWDFLRQNMK